MFTLFFKFALYLLKICYILGIVLNTEARVKEISLFSIVSIQ